MDWLRLVRSLTQYVAPGLAAVVAVDEIIGWLSGAPVLPSVTYTYHYLIAIVFSLLTAIVIGICGWIVWLWDLDRLFFKLENRIDSQIAVLESNSGESGNDGALLGRARELLNGPMDGPHFLAYVEQILAPTLKKGQIVFLDNVSTHKVDGVEAQAKSWICPAVSIRLAGLPKASTRA